MKNNTNNQKLLIDVLHKNSTTEEHLELFHSVLPLGYKISLEIINGKFYNIPLSVEDMYSIIYCIYVDTIKWFRLMKEPANNFFSYFSYKVKNKVLNECRKYLVYGEQIINDTIEYEKASFVDCEPHHTNVGLRNLVIWEILRRATTEQQRIIKLKLFGYTINEISKSTKLSIAQVKTQLKILSRNESIREILEQLAN